MKNIDTKIIRKPKFVSKRPEFIRELRQQVDSYFLKNKIRKTGNWRLYLKTTILLTLFVVLLILPYITTLLPAIHYIMYAGLGLVIGLIGFNIGHDAGHGSYSKKPLVNKIFSYSFDVIAGTSSFLWKFKHNIDHHTYTNINQMDDDIETGNLFRFNKDQEWHWWHLFQWLYALPLYSLLYFQWIFVKDFEKLKTRIVGITEIENVQKKDIVIIILSKVLHITIFWIIPFFFFGFLETFLSYLLMSGVCGLTITIVFQLAHVQSLSHFPVPDQKTGNIENDWAIHQVVTTANFGTRNRLVTEFTGGLNHQVEHHLFPLVSHVHYRKISKIVKDVCEKYNIHYNEYNTMLGAFIDHMKWLWKMSLRPTY